MHQTVNVDVCEYSSYKKLHVGTSAYKEFLFRETDNSYNVFLIFSGVTISRKMLSANLLPRIKAQCLYKGFFCNFGKTVK